MIYEMFVYSDPPEYRGKSCGSHVFLEIIQLVTVSNEATMLSLSLTDVFALKQRKP